MFTEYRIEAYQRDTFTDLFKYDTETPARAKFSKLCEDSKYYRVTLWAYTFDGHWSCEKLDEVTR